ncbi:MAG: hypothetical protein CW716_07520 [Candidatus Bathyarchaeum sp.]|nr:MAG: hypothetical protein CW716_07520 [Candidatus Bathyarchaeum sp.]
MQITLVKLGFTETDTQVYSFLATEGPHNAGEMAEVLNLHRQKLYRSLKKLQNKGIVNASFDYPVKFSAVVFDRVLDLLITVKMEQQQALQESKQELLSTWRSITKKDGWKS